MDNGVNEPKASILIVDDIPDTVQLLKDWLENHNYKATGVTSSLQALEIATEQKPDLILLDVMMPKMDGMETCRRLKANPQTSSIPVILVTAKNPSDARSEGMMAGAIDYITKPINLADLVTRIENALATTDQSPVDVQRLLEEVAHSALTILGSDMVWLLGLDSEEQALKSRILATTGGQRVETDFLLAAGDGQPVPKYYLQDAGNVFCSTFITRKTAVNVSIEILKDDPTTRPLLRATEMLRLSYLTVVPITAAGKTSGVMVLGSLQPHNMESPRALQIVTTLASQSAIALDYSRLITDLTEREMEMRREQAFRQMILDTMSDGLVVIDSKGAIKYVNRRLLRMTNNPKGYLESRSVGELFHPDDRTEIMVGLLREGATTMKFDQRLITRENRVIPVWLTRSRAQSDEMNNQVIVLSDMTEQKQREVELERQTSRLVALNRAAHAITSNLSLHETLQNILHSAMDVVEAQGASLFLFNKDNGDELIVVAAVGSGSEIMMGMHVPVGEGVAGWVAREARSQLVEDTRRDPRFYRAVDEQTGISTQSLVAVPLITAERVIGVVEVVNKLNDDLFTVDDVRLLESMAGTAAVSVVNARLFDETQRRVNELGTLLKASAAASSTLQFTQVLESIARKLADGLEVARCTIMAWNAPKNRLESLAEVCDITWTESDAPRRALSNEPLIRAALTSQKGVVASLLDNQLSSDNRIGLETMGMVAMLAIPVWHNGAIAGVINLYATDHRGVYQDNDIGEASQIVQTWQAAQPDGGNLLTADEAQLNNLADQLLKIRRTCWVMVRTWNESEDSTAVICEKGFAEWTRRPGATLSIENYPTLQAVIQKTEIRMGTLQDLADDAAEVEWVSYRGGHACLIVPLIERGNAIGVVKLIDQGERIFDDGEVRLAQGIANVVSSAMENARLYQSLDSRARALESAYNELQQADKAKDEFIQNVSHELRTPLISVLGYSGLMVEGEFGPITSEQQEALNNIVQKSQKLADIVEDIVSAQASETRTFDRKPVELPGVIRTVLEKHARRAQETGLHFEVKVPQNVTAVLGDPKAITEAFEKLIDNAIKFGSNGEKIEVQVQDSDGPMVQITVRDYGIGIDSSEQQKIFQRFYQVDGGSARRYAGTGLGLAIAKAIIEGHGGRIGVKSKLNEGATFAFTLPKYATMTQ
ncbi:MAG: GAF domain-containing protein [Chloroflexota bacterium]